MNVPERSAVARGLIGGGIDALTTLAIVLTLGLLAFSSLGPSAAGIGIPAAMAAVIVGGGLYALLGTVAAPTGGPSSATTLIFAGLVSTLAADPTLDLSRAADLKALLTLASLCVVLGGAFQILLTLVGAHHLARFVPQPVLAGFMNGVALLILLAQVPPLLGLPPVSHWASLPGLDGIQPLAAVVGAVTVVAVWGTHRRWPGWPANLTGLFIGTAVYWGVSWALPGAPLGPVVGDTHDAFVWPDALAPLFDAPVQALLARHASELAITALVLAVIGSLESLLAAVATDQAAHHRHDSRRELLSMGLANMASGVVGGLPLVLTRARAMTLLDRGQAGHWGPFIAALVFAVLLAVGAPLIAMLPKAVLAGIMVMIAVALVDRWTGRLVQQVVAGNRSPELLLSLGVGLLVCGITLVFGFPVAIVAGTLLSMALLIRGLNRSLIRARFTAAERPSRRVYAPAQEAVLKPLRSRVQVFELEGALFFGSAERLASEVEALDDDARVVILDLRRLTMIDESGAVLLDQLARRLCAGGTRLLLAGVNGHAQRLLEFGGFDAQARRDWHADSDRAIEAAEQWLLAEGGHPTPDAAVELRETNLVRGLDASQFERLRQRLQETRLAAGDVLFREGDAGDRLFVLTRGSVSIVGAGGHRYVSFFPGMIFGETAMLDGHGRSAGAVADTDAVVHALTREDFDRLRADDPSLVAALLHNMAVNLSERLRVASIGWQASAA